jgi:hypothetical protein
MKNYLIEWQPWETKFNDDPVTMQLLPLRRSEFLRLLPMLDSIWKLSQVKDEAGINSASEMSEVLDKIEPIVAEHAKDLAGFTIDGEAPKISDIVSGSVFMSLVSEIVFRLVEISKVDKVSEKNSEGQSQNLQ